MMIRRTWTMTINYIGAFLLIIIGLAIMILKNNLVKIVMGMGILDSGINLLLISIGYVKGGTAPIFSQEIENASAVAFVDPIPQALTLTSIVIGACVTTLALALIIKIKEKYNSVDSRDIRRLNG